MVNSFNQIVQRVFIMALLSAVATSSFGQTIHSPQSVSFNRYTKVQVGSSPEQLNPLSAVVAIEFNDQIKTVGQAVNQMLADCGFRLGNEKLAPEQDYLMGLPLPKVHQSLGPVTATDALKILGGEGYTVDINPISRTVIYKLKDDYRHYFDNLLIELKNTQLLRVIDTDPKPKVQEIYGPVIEGESLSAIVSRLPWHDLTLNQALVLLFDTNSNSFANQNMNHLLVGSMLQIPEANTQSIRSIQEANTIVAQHNQAWIKNRGGE